MEQPKNLDTQNENLKENISKLDPEGLEDKLHTIDDDIDDINKIKAQNDFLAWKWYEVIPDTFQDFVDLLVRVEVRNPDLLALMNNYLKTTGTKSQLSNRDFLTMQEQWSSYIQKQGQIIDVGNAFNAVKQASMHHYQLLIGQRSIAWGKNTLPPFSTLDDARLIYRIMEEHNNLSFNKRIRAYKSIQNPNVIKPLQHLGSVGQFKDALIKENHLYLQNKNTVPKERFPLYNTISTLIGRDLIFDNKVAKNTQATKQDKIHINPESSYVVLPHLTRENISDDMSDYLTTTIWATYPLLSPNRQWNKFSLVLDFNKVFESIKKEQTSVYMDRIQWSSIGSLNTISQQLWLQQLPTTQQYLLMHAINPEEIRDRDVLQAQQKINGTLLQEYVRVQQKTGKKFEVSTVKSVVWSREYTKEDIQAWENSDGLWNNADTLYQDIQTNIKLWRLVEFVPVKGKPEVYTLQWYNTSYTDREFLILTNFMDRWKGEIPRSKR